MEEIVRKFAEAEMQLTKDALEFIRSHPNSDTLADQVLSALVSMERRPFLISSEVVKHVLEKGPEPPPELPPPKPEVKRLPELSHRKFKPLAAEHEPRVRVLKDITSRSYSRGRVEDFFKLFNSRFEKLSGLLRRRVELEGAVSLSSLRGMGKGEKVSVIGMVTDKRRTSGGAIIFDLEDPTGEASVIVPRNDSKLLQRAERVVTDEVVGVVGATASERGSKLFARDILWPSTPIHRERRRAEVPLCAAMISDLHVGSEQFLEEVFRKFIRWLRGNGDADEELAGRVKYLVIAGDVVDGIGVYPEQRNELLITDIYRQYEVAAELLSEVPDYIKVIVIPGNHDAARPSEPQPAISQDIAAPLYERGLEMVGNPVLLSLEGVQFLVYHGRSFDDLVPAVPGLTRLYPTKPMIELLERRHLAPIYGGRTAISPEADDMLVIEEIPDVFHCGHIHRYGMESYRGVLVVNSATFQAKTQYMRKMGVDPTPGYVPVFDLQTHEARVVHFG